MEGYRFSMLELLDYRTLTHHYIQDFTEADVCSEIIRRLGYHGMTRLVELLGKSPHKEPTKILFGLLLKTEAHTILASLLDPFRLNDWHHSFDQFKSTTGDFAEDLQAAIETEYSATLDYVRQFVLYPDEFPVKRIINTYINRMWRERGRMYRSILNMVLFLVNCYLTHRAIRREHLSHAGFSSEPISFIPDWRMSVSGVIRLRILPEPTETFVFKCAHRDDLVFVRTETGLFLKYNFGETLYWQLYFENERDERDVSRLISSMADRPSASHRETEEGPSAVHDWTRYEDSQEYYL